MQKEFIVNTNDNFVGLKRVENKYIYYLPKNFTSTNTSNLEFEKEFEKFINIYIQKQNIKTSPTKVKKSNEDGTFDETNIHSSKLNAWYKLEKDLKKSLKNASSKMYKYTDIFNSKSIERTISRGTFLVSLNSSPIFNQGLLNSDESYKIHYKDELHKLGSFVLVFYKNILNINDEILSIFKSLSDEFKTIYGFNDFKLEYIKTANRLISSLENIINHIEPKTLDILELEKSIRNVILGKDVLVGIDDFQMAWEEIFITFMKKVFGEKFVFDGTQVSIPSDNEGKIAIIPDVIFVNEHNLKLNKSLNLDKTQEVKSLHIFDLKYKNFEKNINVEDWIKQILYIENFLNPHINPLSNKILVDQNIYLIYPDSKNDSKILKVHNYNLHLISLDILELLKIYNSKIVEKNSYTIDIIESLIANTNCFYPNIKFKPFLPNLCFEQSNNLKLLTSSFYNNPNNRYRKYYEYLMNYDLFESSYEFSEKYFSTKKISYDGSKYIWE